MTIRKLDLARASSALALCAAQPAWSQTSAPAPTVGDVTQDSATVDPEAPAEEIVVTGIRGSIANAIQNKRRAINIVDSISAQDIGKLPDQNVVDTLSRVPGVQITRSRGEGANFTIRGISLNNTLINGRTFVGATSDSSARLDVLSSDIVGSIDVIKSPSADMIEGALGGTVNLSTKRPLDLPTGTFALRAQGQYADLAEEVGFRGSALASYRNADRTIGVLGSVAYQYIWTNQQAFASQGGYNRVNDIDGNGDGVNDPGLFRPARLELIDLKRPVERLTLNGALQFKPTDTLELFVDGTYNDYNATGYPQRYQLLLNSNDVGAVADADKTVASGTFNGINQRPLVFQEDDKSTVYAIGARTRWESGPWEVILDGSYGRGKAPFDLGTFTFVVQARAGLTNSVTYDLNGSEAPSFEVGGNYDINDPNNYRVASISDNSNTNDNESIAGRIDVARELNLGFLSRATAGYRYEDRSFYTARRVLSRSLASLVAVADANGDGIITPDELPSLTYGPVSGFLPGVEGDFPRNFLGGRVDAAAARRQFGYDLPPIAPTTVSDVGLKSHAVYLRLDLEGDIGPVPLRGHFGGRYINVKRTSAGNIEVPGQGIQPVSFDKEYSEFLPSAALTLEIQNDLLLRVAAARVIASPPLSDVAAGFVYNITSNTGFGGNPLLDPYKADQADVSLEYYFGRGNLLAASIFYKKVKSFTTLFITEETIPGFENPNGTGNVFRITRPRNGSDGEVKGFEVNYQHAFSFLPAPFDGLGLQANYTYADSQTPIIDELTQETLPLPLLSKHSYSLIGYYEKGPVQARLAYTWRDDYLLAVQSAAQAGSRYIASQNQLDASLQFEVFEDVKLTLDAQNLLRSPTRQYDGVPGRPSLISIDDRRFLLGFSATF